MLPFDSLKTHYQAGSHLPFGQLISNIYQHGGIKNFYSGSKIVAVGCVPAHAIYFSIYEEAKLKIGRENQDNHYKYLLVGVITSLFHDLIMTPTEVVKQRLQLIGSHTSGIQTKDVIKYIYKHQGIVSFYRSFGINYLTNVPFSSMIIYMNEKMKHLFKVKERDSMLNYYFCGGLAGCLASIPTTPFDVIKTKLNTQASLSNIE